jgi:hypothetical protein
MMALAGTRGKRKRRKMKIVGESETTNSDASRKRIDSSRVATYLMKNINLSLK